MKSVVFTNDRGYAMGYNPKAPEPYVTWQFYEAENGARDYNWGHYFVDEGRAEKDFAKRAEEHKHSYGVEERPDRRPEAQPHYRYFSTQRPVDIGTFPKPPDNKPLEIFNYDERMMVEGGIMRAWGELIYAKSLTEKQMDDYELKPAKDNPDRAKAPSITAQLKESTSRSTPPREQNKPTKTHEDR